MTTTAPRPFVFVLMPFDRDFRDVYRLGIKPAAEHAGAYCERIDEQIFAESILSRIYNQIAKADLIVADMTGRNPNVFYEVGYAHALGKTAILVTQNSDDIPFDLKHYPHIIYGGSISDLKDELHRRIQFHLANPDTQITRMPSRLEFTIAGTLIATDARIPIPYDDQQISYGKQVIPLGIHNPEDTVVNWRDSRLALALPEEFRPMYGYAAVQLRDKRFLHDLGTIGQFLPDQWNTVQVDLPVDIVDKWRGIEIAAELKTFTKEGPISVGFFLKFV
jgi:hypothetical protein